MASEHQPGVLVRAPAKINLGLRVLGKRPDGFHEIETIFAAVDLYDELRFTPSGDGTTNLQLRTPDPDFNPVDLDTSDKNLVIRAWRLVEEKSGRSLPVDIRLTKRIPVAAGLGGGSSDAAATLAGLNAVFELEIDNETLQSWGSELGSDVPFFLGSAAAIGRGRGEKLTPIALYHNWFAVLATPHIALSAGSIYAALDLTDRPSEGHTPQSLDGDGFFDAIDRLRNDLQEAVISRAPVVSYWCRQLVHLGAQGAFVSGSGPTVVGLFRQPPDRNRLTALEDRGARIILVRPVDSPTALTIGKL